MPSPAIVALIDTLESEFTSQKLNDSYVNSHIEQLRVTITRLIAILREIEPLL